MKYEEFIFVDPFTEKETTYITHFIDESNAVTFAADEANVNYQAYLAWKAEN